MTDRKLILGVFLHAAGYHVAGWRHAAGRSDTEDIAYLTGLCQTAEAGGFHLAFVADGLSTSVHANASVAARLEPLTMLSAVAVQTRRIGLVATVSTTYSEPYTVARQLATLDHISGGRAGWNIVTSTSQGAARNYGAASLPSPAERYARGEEFVDVADGLWHGWDEGALLRDKASGRYLDPAKLHTLNHQGAHFSVAGPLNTSRSPQGRPVLVQAGSSVPGRRLAARVADLVFTAQPTLEDAQRFYRDIKQLAAREFGRAPGSLRVLPGVVPFIGRTEAEARALYVELQEKLDTRRASIALGERFGVDFSGFDLDAPLPADLLHAHMSSRETLLRHIADRERLTARQLYRIMAGTNGHLPLIGTAGDVAEHLATWFENGAADGFNIMPPYMPGGLERFIEDVVPILRKRGVLLPAATRGTLRDTLGLGPADPLRPRTA